MAWQFLLLISIFSRSFSMLVQKSMLKGIDKDPIAYAIVYQLLTGILIVTSLLLVGFHPHNFQSVIPNFIITTSLGGVGTILMFHSLKLIDASEFAVLYSSRVIWTIIGTVIFLKAPFSFHQTIGAVLIIGSVILVSWKVKKIQFSKGELLALISAFCFGTAVANDVVAVQHVDVVIYTALAYIFPALFTWLIFPKSTKHIIQISKNKTSLKLVLFCFLLAITTITNFDAYKIGNPAQITALYQTSTILAVILAIIILKETTNLKRKILGAIISFIGILFVK